MKFREAVICKRRVRKKIADMRLHQKVMSIILIGVAVMAVTAVILLHMTERMYQKMLHRSMADSLSYSADEIVDYLEKMEDMSMLLLADEIAVGMGNENLRKMANIEMVKTYLAEIYDKYQERPEV